MASEKKRTTKTQKASRAPRLPSTSPSLEKAIPVLLVGMAVLMGVLILFAAGILLGFISF